jgi:hypothetical protein
MFCEGFRMFCEGSRQTGKSCFLLQNAGFLPVFAAY